MNEFWKLQALKLAIVAPDIYADYASRLYICGRGGLRALGIKANNYDELGMSDDEYCLARACRQIVYEAKWERLLKSRQETEVDS
jgi:hypothetical protein